MSVAPAAYEALLARCWDVLHAFRPGVNVVAFATAPSGNDDPAMPSPSHSPVEFIRGVGDAYRASNRRAPLFDTVSHHVYGASPGERPWQRHTTSKRISEGDLGKLVDTLQAGFNGTKQATPGMPVDGRTVPIWYLESGFQTTPSPAKAALYSSSETTTALPDWTGGLPWSVLPNADSPAPDQATQLRDAVRLAYCQPYVTAIFNFLLRDQPELSRWQSGVLWTDGSPKASYVAWRGAIAEANLGTVNCSLFADPSAQPPTGEGDEPASRTADAAADAHAATAVRGGHHGTARADDLLGRQRRPRLLASEPPLARVGPRQPASSLRRDHRDAVGEAPTRGARDARAAADDDDRLPEAASCSGHVPGRRAERQHRPAQRRLPRSLKMTACSSRAQPSTS